MSLFSLTVSQARAALDRREISAVELTRAVLERMAAREPRIGAFLTVTAEQALQAARKADEALARGESRPLTGIPLAVKDVICTKGVRTTCASRMLENFVPPYDAFVMERLNAQNAVMVGKLNLDEFAMGSTTEHSAFKVTRNPWDLRRSPGGSSGGSAAAVAAEMCLAALGSDSGGSIRQPAAHCGVVGLKPTYGRVSRYGLVSFAPSLDQIGPMARSVADCALVLQAIAGHDPADALSAPQPVPDYTAALARGVKGLQIGVPTACFERPELDPAVALAVRAALRTLEELGARLVEIALPHSASGVAAYLVIGPCEASSNLARYDGVRYGLRAAGDFADAGEMYGASRSAGLGAEVRRRILLGTWALSADNYATMYRKAAQVRSLVCADYRAALATCDLIALPVTPRPAPLLGETAHDPLAGYMADIFTLGANLAGIPAMALPCGYTDRGLPIGLQLQAAAFQEEVLLRAAYAFEQVAAFNHRRPVLEE